MNARCELHPACVTRVAVGVWHYAACPGRGPHVHRVHRANAKKIEYYCVVQRWRMREHFVHGGERELS